jgi:hypothetical protein
MKHWLMLSLLAAAAGTHAHHGWSGYDASRPLKLQGTIQESGYAHPHGFIKLKTEDKTWHVVLAPPTRMENRGLPKNLLKAGNRAAVEGYPSRDEPQELRAERISIGDKVTELR